MNSVARGGPIFAASVAGGRLPSPWAIATAAVIQVLLIYCLQFLPATGDRGTRLFQVIPIGLLFDQAPAPRVPEAAEPQAPPRAVQAPSPPAPDILDEVQARQPPVLPPLSLPDALGPSDALDPSGALAPSDEPTAAQVEQMRSAFRQRFCVLTDSEKSRDNADCPDPLEGLSGPDQRYVLERDLGAVLGPEYAGLSLREAVALKGYRLKGQPRTDRYGNSMALPDPKSPDLTKSYDLADQMFGPLPLPSHVPAPPPTFE